MAIKKEVVCKLEVTADPTVDDPSGAPEVLKVTGPGEGDSVFLNTQDGRTLIVNAHDLIEAVYSAIGQTED